MEKTREFYAFISYKREDEKWAKWLQDKLEHYKFPTNLNGRTDLPKEIRPTFRDVTNLEPGLLEERIDAALHNSQWLIVVCSPRSAQSPWVCKEAQSFIDQGRADRIIPFVIEGTPFSNDIATECYPDALRSLTGSQELLAANINEMGRDAAVIKVVACMFGLRFDTLWQRHERQKRRRRNWIIAAVTAFVLAVLGVAGYILHLNNQLEEEKAAAIDARDQAEQAKERAELQRARAEQAEDSIRGQNQLITAQQSSILQANRDLTEERNRLVAANNELLIRESNILAHEAERIMDDNAYLAQRLALAALPTDLVHPDRPYVADAERALRRSFYRHSGFIGSDIANDGWSIPRILPSVYRKDAPFNTSECVFQSNKNIIYQVDLIEGTRRPVIEVSAPIVSFVAFRSMENLWSLSDYPRMAILQKNQIIGLYELDDDKWVQYDTIDLTYLEMPNNIDVWMGKMVCCFYGKDSTYVLNKLDDELWEVEKLKGGLCSISSNIIATYSKKDEKIYVFRGRVNYGRVRPILQDTLETAGEIYHLSIRGYGNRAIIVAGGANGIHIYQCKQYGSGKDREYCWMWTDLIKHINTSNIGTPAIMSVNEFYTEIGGYVWQYVRKCMDGDTTWVRSRMDNIPKANFDGEVLVSRVDYGQGENLLVYETSTGRLQYINQNCTRYNKSHTRDDYWRYYYYQDGTNNLKACLLYSKRDPAILIRNTSPSMIVDTLYGHSDTIYGISYDNGHLLSWSKDSTLRVWKRFDGRYRCIDSIHNAVFTSCDDVGISSDRSIVYCKGGFISRILLRIDSSWSVVDSLYNYDLSPSPFSYPAIISRNNTIASYYLNDDSTTPTVALYYPHLNKWKELCHTLSNNTESCIISPAGNAVVGIPWVTSKTMSLYIIENGSVVNTKRLIGHADVVTSVSFSSDGTYMVSIAKDSTVRVWHIPSGECLEVFSDIKDDRGEKLNPRRAFFSEDGTLISVVGDLLEKKRKWTNVYFYDFPPLQQLIDRTRKRYKDTPFTSEERRKYLLK